MNKFGIRKVLDRCEKNINKRVHCLTVGIPVVYSVYSIVSYTSII